MRRQQGMTLVEVLAVLALLGLGLGAAALYLRPLEMPLQTGVALTQGMFDQCRLKAMATTSAYRVSPADSGTLVGASAPSCASGTWTADPGTTVELPDGVSIDTGWSVCFSARGVSSDNLTVQLSHAEYGTRQVEVLLGGTTRVLP